MAKSDKIKSVISPAPADAAPGTAPADAAPGTAPKNVNWNEKIWRKQKH